MRDIRRVVTAQSKTGQAIITSDGPVPTVIGNEGGPVLAEIWKTTSASAVLSTGEEEPAAGEWRLEPPPGGSVFRISEIPPDAMMAKSSSTNAVFEQIGEGAAVMHRTQTIDYAIVLKGHITLIVENAETNLNPGDVVIQRGANHAWSNRTNEPCRMAFVMIAARYP